MTENEISKIVFELGLKIHRKLGVGLYERVYEECLMYELTKAGLKAERQKFQAIQYEELFFERAYRMDILVEDKVVIDLKSVEFISDSDKKQLNNYLRLGNYKLGMILNFNSTLFKDGVKRIANGL